MKPRRFHSHRSSTLLLGSAVLFTASSLHAADRYWDQAVFAAAPWSTATNWDTDTAPLDGDNLFFGRDLAGATPGVAITTGTSQANYSLNIANLNFANAANLTLQAQSLNPAMTLTLNNITFNSAVNDVAGVPTAVTAGGLTISRAAATAPAVVATVALGSNATWDLSGLGSIFSGLSVTAPLVGNFSITKVGPRSMTLSSGLNTFSGGIINRRSTVFTGSFSASGNLGTGPFTFGNESSGVNDAVNSLSLNNGFTSNFLNAIVNDNASSNPSNLANLSIGTNAALYTQTLSGKVTTGLNFNPVQVLRVGINNGTLGTQEGTLVFKGDWTEYVSPIYGINLGGGGTIRLGSATSIAATNYQLGGGTAAGLNSAVNSNKIILDGAYTVNQRVGFLGDANGMRNSFGTRTAAGTTATLAGDATSALSVTDNDGANIFAHNAGSTLAVTGIVTGGVNARIRINDSYTFVTGNSGVNGVGTSTLQKPAGTVSFANDANTFTGGVTVANGTFQVNNTAGSGTGTGQVTVGLMGAATSAQTATSASSITAIQNTRILTGFTTATAQTLQIGQTITGSTTAGTGVSIPDGTVITGITLGTTAAIAPALPNPANSTIAISKSIPVPINATTTASYLNIATTAFTTNATLGGTGIIAPTGTNGLLVNSGSTLGLVDGVIEDLAIDLTGTTGGATFESGATFAFELGDTTTSDRVAFSGLDDSALTLNGNVINLASTGTITSGTHTYTLMTFAPDLLVAPALVLGPLPLGFSAASLNQEVGKIELTVTYTPPYDTFIDPYSSITGADRLPTADPDGDGLVNQQEFAFGLAPDSGASVNPYVSMLNKTNGLFTYTRRGPAVSGLTFSYEYSTSLAGWTPFTPDSAVTNGGTPIEAITVDLPNALLTNPKIFVRVIAK